jgi:hypothetical protein
MLRNQLELPRFFRIQRPHDPITGSRSQSSDEKCLYSPFYSRYIRSNSVLVLNISKCKQYEHCDADGDEESVRNVVHYEVGNHGNKTSCG